MIVQLLEKSSALPVTYQNPLLPLFTLLGSIMMIFSMAILANAKAGGDNCHRGVVVGSIVAMQTEFQKFG